jgi:hypothetical protein
VSRWLHPAKLLAEHMKIGVRHRSATCEQLNPCNSALKTAIGLPEDGAIRRFLAGALSR